MEQGQMILGKLKETVGNYCLIQHKGFIMVPKQLIRLLMQI